MARVFDTVVSLTPAVAIKPGKKEEYKKLWQDETEVIKKKAKAEQIVSYGFSFSGESAQVREMYASAVGLQKHFQDVGPKIKQSAELSDMKKLILIGPADELTKLKPTFQGLSAEYYNLVFGHSTAGGVPSDSDTIVSLFPRFKILDGKIDEFLALWKSVYEEEEAGVPFYAFAVNEERNVVMTREGYTNADSVKAHQARVVDTMKKSLQFATVEHLDVTGPKVEIDKLRDEFKEVNATFWDLEWGFAPGLPPPTLQERAIRIAFDARVTVVDMPATKQSFDKIGASFQAFRKDLAMNRLRRISLEKQNAAATVAATAKEEELKVATEELNKASVVRLRKFVQERAALYDDVKLTQAWFEFGASLTPSELREAHGGVVDPLFANAAAWVDKKDKAASSATHLHSESAFLATEGCEAVDVTALNSALTDTNALFEKHSAAWLREMGRRKDYDRLLVEFQADHAKLMQWCRQQVATLRGMTANEEIQEFCASFHSNTQVMEANFLVLLEMSEALLPNATVEKQLCDVAEVWLSLEMFAFDKLRSTLLDLHSRSGLDNETRSWPAYSRKLKTFLGDAERLLLASDEASRQVVAPLLDSIRQLQADHDAHLLIVEHLADFGLREECIRDHYNSIHKSIFSKLTLLTQSFPGLFTYARKQEYTDRMAELGDWIECKSQSAPWKEMLARVDRMRRLIEDNESMQKAKEEAS